MSWDNPQSDEKFYCRTCGEEHTWEELTQGGNCEECEYKEESQ